MRVAIIGGGPAGLYLAILLRLREVAAEVTVFESNSVDATFGWGIVFSGATLANLQAADQASHDAIRSRCQVWDEVRVVHKGEEVLIGGNDFVGVERMAFLRALQGRARDLGADLRFNSAVDSGQLQRLVESHDLVVAADGVGSMVRSEGGRTFLPEEDARLNRYVWLGTAAPIRGLTMIFRQAPEGLFIAHAYRYSPEMSTFVVECDPATYRRSGLGSMQEADALSYLSGVFADDLGRAPLLGKDYRWVRFTMLRCGRWSDGNVVLIGDALHTAHFSIGSGTKLALEDAIALAGALESLPAQGAMPVPHGAQDAPLALAAALTAFEAGRRPGVEAYQAASQASLVWLEDLGDDLDLEPLPFAYKLMTRSGRVTHESIARRDPIFASEYAQWCRQQGHPPPA